MKLIDADKLHMDKQINGECWISQEQIINAPTVEAVPLSVIENIKTEIECRMNDIKEVYEKNKTSSMKGYVLGLDRAFEIIEKAVKEYAHE